jgi:hypothetical protein
MKSIILQRREKLGTNVKLTEERHIRTRKRYDEEFWRFAGVCYPTFIVYWLHPVSKSFLHRAHHKRHAYINSA